MQNDYKFTFEATIIDFSTIKSRLKVTKIKHLKKLI